MDAQFKAKYHTRATALKCSRDETLGDGAETISIPLFDYLKGGGALKKTKFGGNHSKNKLNSEG